MRRLWLVTLVACGRINFGTGDGSGDDTTNVAIRSACMLQSSGSITAETVTADAAGNLYLLGSFGGTLTAGTLTMTNTGLADRFVISFAPDCTVRWGHQFVNVTTQTGIFVTGRASLALDSQGSVLVVSDWREMLDPGDGLIRVAAGGADIFVAKLDATGALAWLRPLGGLMNDIAGGGVVVTGDDVIVAGSFFDTITVGTLNKTSLGGNDILFARYRSDGTLLSADSFGGAGNDYVSRIAADASERVYAAGGFTLTTNLGTGALTSNGDYDIFVARYASGSVAEMTKSFGGTLAEYGFGVAVDGQSRVTIVGQLGGTVDFGTGPLTTVGGSDIYVLAIDDAGAPRWVRQFGGLQSDFGEVVASDATGNLIVAGSFADTVDFGDGPRTAISRDGFVVSLSPDGTTRWVQTVEASVSAAAEVVGIDRSGGVLVAGTFNGAVTLGDSTFDSGALSGAFVARIR